jgi:hypothetical protein
MLFAIQYQTGNDSFLSLEEIREKLPSTNWRHSRVFEDIGVAIELGMTPTRFAYQRAKSTIQGYEHYLMERDAKRGKGKGKG